MKHDEHTHGQTPSSTPARIADEDELGSNLGDLDSDLDEYNLTADRFWPVEFRSAPATTSYEQSAAVQDSKKPSPSDDSHVDYRIRGRSLRQKKSGTAAYYPAPNQILIGPRNHPASRFVKLHGTSAVDPMAAMTLAPYAMLSKVTKIHGLSDRLSLRSHLQSQTSTCDE